MEQKLIESIMAGLTTILVTIIGYLTVMAKTYIDKKAALLEQQLGVEKTNQLKNLALDAYYMIEQQYKGVESVANAKRVSFDQYLLNKVPGLTQGELDHLRESICGEINSQLK